MEINAQLFDKICRVCLIQSNELKSLFIKLDGEERDLFQILSFTADINVKIEDNLPKQVCNTCESIMCKADAFKRRCLESETILKNVIQNPTANSECSDIAQNCLIKTEKVDLKQKLIEYGTVISPIPTNSTIKDDYDNENVFFSDLPGHCTKDSGILREIACGTNCDQSVKEEDDINTEEDNSFLDHFDDNDHIDSPKNEKEIDNKVKAESKSIAIRYECYCRAHFLNKDEYKTHLKLNKCNKVILYGKNKQKVVIDKLECEKCDTKFTSASAWTTHQETHHKNSIIDVKQLFQCSLCLRKFKNKISLASHVKRHEIMDNIKHVCDVCKREFKYKAYLENHVLTVHSRTNGADRLINKEKETNNKSTEEDKKHRCNVCSKGFLMLCTLKEHMRTHTGEKPFLCSQCGKGFSQKTNLAQHMRRHQGLKPFKCESCEKRFVSKGELDAHSRKHSGAHPFVCDECGNGFTTSSALVKHRRIHTGERPYQCDLCPMRFAASGTLKNHRRTHTGERPFQCSYCEKAFVQRNDLVSHIRCHTGERPFVCNQCGQAFRKASGMKVHLKLHIKNPVIGINALLTGMPNCPEQ